MGENKKNIYVVGSPDIDIINQNDLPKLEENKLKYDLDFKDYSISIYIQLLPSHQNLSI